MSELSNRQLALELAVRASRDIGNGTGITLAAAEFLKFLEGAAAPPSETATAGEAPAASSGKKSRASRAAMASTQTVASASSVAESELFGSASEGTAPAKEPTKESGPSA